MKKIAIIGGGLAGTACAYILKRTGFSPVIYELGAQLAIGASGNETGLYNPRIAAEKNAESEYFMKAYALALATFPVLENIDWTPCGAFHLITDEKREKKFIQAIKNWPDAMQFLKKSEVWRICGVQVEHDALYLKYSGTVSPQKLCEAYAKDIEVVYNADVKNLSAAEADYIILACGTAIKNYTQLPLKGVRGQVTYIKATEQSADLKSNLCYGGYVSPPKNGIHTLGATFQRWLEHSDIIEEDDTRNLEQLFNAVPALSGDYKIIGHRAAIRTTSPDHMPVVGGLSDNIFVSTAHGSHGILSSLLAANVITDQIVGKETILSSEALKKISPDRFR